MSEKDSYFVAVKVFLKDKGKLFIFQDGFGDWDLPGGRIRKDEFAVPLEQVVSRKMSEELGNDVKFKLGKPIVYMRHERIENTPGNPAVRIFALGYKAEYESGEIKLPSHHKQLLWVDINDFRPDDYFTGGWLNGVKEYLELQKRIPVPES